MSEPSLAELLRVIADAEPLDRVAARLGLTTVRVAELLREGAGALDFVPPKSRARAPTQTEFGAPAAPKTPAVPSISAPPVPVAPTPAAGALTRLVIFSDGASRGNPGPAGAGAVLSTPEGRVVARIGKFLGIQTNNVAEYEGVIIALEKALEIGARDLEIRADSMLVIMQLRGEWKLKHPGLKPYFDKARELLRRFDRTNLQHVRRELNAEADEMSNRAIDERL